MLVPENIPVVTMLVSKGGESNQTTLIRCFSNLRRRTLVYRSVRLCSRKTAIRKTMIISHFGAIKSYSQCSTSTDKIVSFHPMCWNPQESPEVSNTGLITSYCSIRINGKALSIIPKCQYLIRSLEYRYHFLPSWLPCANLESCRTTTNESMVDYRLSYWRNYWCFHILRCAGCQKFDIRKFAHDKLNIRMIVDHGSENQQVWC